MSQVSLSETDHSDRQICEWVDEWFVVVHQRHLSDVELQVLQGAWRGKTYDAIATESYLTVKYVSEVGGRLWQMLGQVLNEDVKKSNFRPALLRHIQKNDRRKLANPTRSASPSASDTPMPNAVPYIDRPPLESCCYSEIGRSGALLRLKAPLQCGKTTLMSKVLHYAEQQQYRTVMINLRDAVGDDFASLDRFLVWFLEVISQAVGLTIPIETHWKTSLGNSKIKCRTFLEKNVLTTDSATNLPLVIAIDELDRIFAYPAIAGEFLGMLRTWHEDAKTKPIWGFVRFMVLYTEIYTQLDINQSPFNAGVEFCLQDFDRSQVVQLVQAYGLNWTDESVDRLMDLVGGQPYLITQALRSIVQSSCTLMQLINNATAPNSIYRSHLERQWHLIQSQPALQDFLVQLLQQPLILRTGDQIELAVKLFDVGVIALTQVAGLQQATFCYRLYEQYFGERLGGRG